MSAPEITPAAVAAARAKANMTVGEAAQWCGVHRTTFMRWEEALPAKGSALGILRHFISYAETVESTATPEAA